MLDGSMDLEHSSLHSPRQSSRGYRKASLANTIPYLPVLSSVTSATSHRQWIAREGSIVRGRTKTLTWDDSTGVGHVTQTIASITSSTTSGPSETALVEGIEKALSCEVATGETHMDYLTFDEVSSQSRSGLELPTFPDTTNEHLLRTCRAVPNVHGSLICHSHDQSFNFLHKCDMDLQSTTVLWCGEPIVWVVISPEDAWKLEASLVEELALQHECSQFVRHEDIIVPPSTLKSWGVNFDVLVQLPGEVVTTEYQAYHYSWKTGPNLTEMMASCDASWRRPPPMYVYCQEGKTKCDASMPSTVGMPECTIGWHSPEPQDLSDEVRTKDSTGSFNRHGVNDVGDIDGIIETDDLMLDLPSLSGHTPSFKTNSATDAEKQATSNSTSNSRGFDFWSTAEANCGLRPNDVQHDDSDASVSIPFSLASHDEITPPTPIGHKATSVRSGRSQPLDLDVDMHDSPDQSSQCSSAYPDQASQVASSSPAPAEDKDFPSDSEFGLSRWSARRLPPPSSQAIQLGPDPSNDLAESVTDHESSNCSVNQETDDVVEDAPELTREREEGQSPLFQTSEIASITEPGPKSPSPPIWSSPDEVDMKSSILDVSPKSSYEKHVESIISISSSPPSPKIQRTENPTVSDHVAATRLQNVDSTMSTARIAQDIEDLIEFGCRYWNDIHWRTARPDDAEKTLSRFRPGEWLNDDAVMEILYRLTSTRDDVHVVQSHDFSAAYDRLEPDRIRRWKSPSLVLIPVYLKAHKHWFLVSAWFKDLKVIIHERQRHYHKQLEDFLSVAFPALKGWALKHKDTSENDGNNCGIILLKEAETILKPHIEDMRNFDLMRKRYLIIILGDILNGSHEYAGNNGASIEENVNWGSERSQDSSTDRRLDCLASAIGSPQVLQDFLEMIKIIRQMPGGVDSRTEEAFRIYERARIHEILDQENPVDDLSSNLEWGVEDALRFYQQKRPVSGQRKQRDFSGNKSRLTQQDIQLDLRLITRGVGEEKLGRFKQQMAAFNIARCYRILHDDLKDEIHEDKLGSRRKYVPDQTPGKSGPKASKLAYAKLLEKCASQNERVLAELKNANSVGSHLLHYEAVCGRNHPLWTLVPARNIRCLEEDACTIIHTEYLKLSAARTKVLVDLVKSKYPRLWDILPKLAEETAKIFRGEQADFGFLEQLVQ